MFGAGDKCPPISATKSLTGHSLGATGVQEAIYSLLMMNNGFICESANIEKLDPAFADMPIVRKRIDNAKLGTRAVELVRLRRHQRDAACSAATTRDNDKVGSLVTAPATRQITGTSHGHAASLDSSGSRCTSATIGVARLGSLRDDGSDSMQGKRGLIMGVANDHSIAWGIAKTLAAHGAELAFTYQGEALGKRVRPLAQSLGSDLVLPCDVEDIASVDAVFADPEEATGAPWISWSMPSASPTRTS